MKKTLSLILLVAFFALNFSSPSAQAKRVSANLRTGNSVANFYNVVNFGAKGDGKTIDSPAINRALTRLR